MTRSSAAKSNQDKDCAARARQHASLPLALTMGDPAGIGPEIVLSAWQARAHHGLAPFVYYGDARVLESCASALNLDVPIKQVSNPRDATTVFGDALPVLNIPVPASVIPGKADSQNGAAVIGAIERAVSDIAQGSARAIVTAPIAKSVLYACGFSYPGHTEFLAALAETHWPHAPVQPVMMLVCDALRVVPTTIHIPLKDVPGRITPALVSDTVTVTWHALRDQFAITHPRIAVAGLNPHAGESGTIGQEDVDIIAPALEALRACGLEVSGPHPADTLFHAAARNSYDAAVCMYHDQALIPIKTLAFDEGVNVTLGLPFVRTSPDHGTAFDIAGKGIASPTSLIEALKLADKLSGKISGLAPQGAQSA